MSTKVAGLPRKPLPPASEVEDCILLGNNGHTIPCGWLEMPFIQCCEKFLVKLFSHTAENCFPNNLATFINRNLNDYVTLSRRQFPG